MSGLCPASVCKDAPGPPGRDRAHPRRRCYSRNGAPEAQSKNSSAGPVTEIRLKATITLAMRVSCAISIGTIDGSFPPGTTMRGLDGVNSSIGAHIMSIFEPGPLTDEIFKLPRIFNARNLVKIAGIQICWTSNLADHLLMTDDETKVTIFHHGSFLKLHSASKQNLLSQELIEETLNTFTLLLPSNDPAVQKWFRKQQAKGRDIKNFKFWKDRLIILKQAFDDAEPRSVTQWWYDDRKRVQWYTFWVAALVLLLTIVFGVIQSATAVVQTWKTMHS